MTMTPRLITIMLWAPSEDTDEDLAQWARGLIEDHTMGPIPDDKLFVRSKTVGEESTATFRRVIFGEGDPA